MIACLGLLVFGGKKAGQQLARSGIIERSGSKQKAVALHAGELPHTASDEALRPDLVASTLKRIRNLAVGSSDLANDWEAQMQMNALLAKLNAAELAEVFAGISGVGGRGHYLIERLVGAAWMAKDPDTALKAALERTPGRRGYLAQSIFGSWAQDDPKTALAWLDSAVLPEEPANLREELRGDALMGLVERDFDLACAEFLKMRPGEDPEFGHSSPMRVWGHMYADDPAMRERLLAFAKSTGRPGDYAELNHHLLKHWPQEDAMGMMNYLHEVRGYLESDAVTAEARPEVDGAAVAAAIYREYDRPALEWWMERYGDSRDLPAPMWEAMAGWAHKSPDAMLQWFDEQPPSPQRDALAAATIPILIQQKKFAEVAERISNMQDPGYRQSATERLEILWKEADPAAAANWRAGMEGGRE